MATMSWLRNSQFRSSFNVKRVLDSPPKNCDPVACTDSFKNHWLQTLKIIDKTQLPGSFPLDDDVLGVVNHLGQMVNLLVVELQSSNYSNPSNDNSNLHSPCFEYLLSNSILEKLLDWSFHTGKFRNLVIQEQINLFELLVSQSGQTLLVHEPFVKPLLRLLTACCAELFPVDLERRLVLLLNQLSVSITQNVQLLDLFFNTRTPSTPSSFVLFSLLIKFVHREGEIGQQSRDALLLLLSISKENDSLGAYIVAQSDMCPVLATGLNGLYSRLPRKLDIFAEDWHCLTPDDVNQMPDLTLFINSLEFCNSVVQVSHRSVKEQLIDFIHNGFLRPVIGPALLQSTVDELIAATAYYDLFLKSTSTVGIRNNLVQFLLRDEYDGQRILSTLIHRINSQTKVCLITLALLETLIGLDSEDVMSELVFQHLVPCRHIMLSQRLRLREIDVYGAAATKLLAMTPSVCVLRGGYSGLNLPSPSIPYGLRPEDSLYANYHAYLCDARARIRACAQGCVEWRNRYDGEVELVEEATTSLHSVGESSGYESLAHKGSPQSTSQPSPENTLSTASGDKPDDDDETSASVSQRDTLSSSQLPTPDVGPFLDAIFRAVDRMPDNGLYLNLRITAIVSRLAVYPHPLLSSLLLNHSLVFQPSVRSLFQILRSLKQTLDTRLSRVPNVEEHIHEGKSFLLTREKKLATIRKNPIDAPASDDPAKRFAQDSNFNRGDNKRRSLSSAFSFLKRFGANANLGASEQLLENDDGSGYRYVRRKSRQNSVGSGLDVKDTVICALIMDEWLKELAAISQEQALFALSAQNLFT